MGATTLATGYVKIIESVQAACAAGVETHAS